jgi:Membrane proteins related to metalloendopeptidases
VNKGKVRESAKKYLSIAFIPHSSNEVKVFKVASFYSKVFSICILLVTILSCSAVIISQTAHENSELKQSMNELYNANAEQRKLLEEKSAEINKLKDSDKAYKESIDKITKEFTKDFNEITDKYITGQSSSKTSRSGERTVQGFSTDISNLKDILDKLNKLSSSDNASLIDLSEASSKLDKYFETIPTLWPVNAEISDTFGYRKDPFTRRKTFHEGLDLAADRGVGIKASASGKVTLAGRYGGYGLAVIIDHGKGLSTLYGHTSKLLVKEGQIVKKGDIIAKVGSSGRSTGPHLHFEVRLYDTSVDPLQYLDKK